MDRKPKATEKRHSHMADEAPIQEEGSGTQMPDPEEGESRSPEAPAMEQQDASADAEDSVKPEEPEGEPTGSEAPAHDLMEDLFGSSSAEESENEEEKKEPAAPGTTELLSLTHFQSRRRTSCSKEEAMVEDNQEAGAPEGVAEEEEEPGAPLQFDTITVPHPPRSVPIELVRLPNILGLEPKVFNPDTYEEIDPTEEYFDEATQRKQLLHPETVIRWRYAPGHDGADGKERAKESNSRFVRWSDGTLSLLVGEELYEVAQQQVGASEGYLFCRQPASVIECHGKIRTKLTFRPSGLGSKTHVSLTESIVQRHKKERRIRLVATDKDPEMVKQRLEEEHEDKLRASQKLASAQARRRRSAGLDMEGGELTTAMLEQGYSSGEEPRPGEEGSVAAIKARFGKKARRRQQRSRAEEESILRAKDDDFVVPDDHNDNDNNDREEAAADRMDTEETEERLTPRRKRSRASGD